MSLAGKLGIFWRRARPGHSVIDRGGTPKRRAGDAQRVPVSCETGLACLFRLGIQNGVHTDTGAVRRRNVVDGPILPLSRLSALAGEFGLEAEHARLDWSALQTGSFANPPMLILNNTNAVILMGVRRGGAEEVAISDPLFRDGEIFFLGRAELERSWAGETLIVSPLPPTRDDAKFGFSWFTSKLFAERGLIRDVVVAALAMHLIALSVPIFFQILVDKVVPNQAFSTLYTITAGIFVLILFDGGFNYMRNYLLAFVTRKLDRVIATDTIDHLLRLPIDYFHANPSGVTAYKLQEANNVREFVASRLIQYLSRFSVSDHLSAGLADLFLAFDADRTRRLRRGLCSAERHVARVPHQIARRQRHRRAAQGVSVRDPERGRNDQDPGPRTPLDAAVAALHRRGRDQDPVARPHRRPRPQRRDEPRALHERRHRRARRAVRAERPDDGRRADRLQHAGVPAGAAADPRLHLDAGISARGIVAETAGPADADQARAGDRPAGAADPRPYRIRGRHLSLSRLA